MAGFVLHMIIPTYNHARVVIVESGIDNELAVRRRPTLPLLCTASLLQGHRWIFKQGIVNDFSSYRLHSVPTIRSALWSLFTGGRRFDYFSACTIANRSGAPSATFTWRKRGKASDSSEEKSCRSCVLGLRSTAPLHISFHAHVFVLCRGVLFLPLVDGRSNQI